MNTPKTDAACGWPWGHHGRIESSDLRWSPDGPFVHSEVARALERENAALLEQSEWVVATFGNLYDENKQLRAEIDSLKSALEALAVSAMNREEPL